MSGTREQCLAFLKNFKRPSITVLVGSIASVIGFLALLAGIILGAITIWAEVKYYSFFSADVYQGVLGLMIGGGVVMTFGLCAVCGGCFGCYFGWIQLGRECCCGESCCLCVGDGCECLAERVLETSCCELLYEWGKGAPREQNRHPNI
ncbi:hypothetical protein C9374_003644 [Naegleria lovaniensis]|uniref:Transmembrane protein n=1 Tax=Naegleria lovaniensis TaxID=51637 RepID=A0AA88KYC3_NAELO|nr:uncharacterized protein C9374_003644 [Naegleria lovaniensis]KAG2393880.1 hypothetical protein C9374_003644 [Naegleria lovaniensis]